MEINIKYGLQRKYNKKDDWKEGIVRRIMKEDKLNGIFALKIIKESANCIVEESNGIPDCTKNRQGFRTMRACEDYEFERIKLSELSGTFNDLRKQYYGKNVWVLLDN